MSTPDYVQVKPCTLGTAVTLLRGLHAASLSWHSTEPEIAVQHHRQQRTIFEKLLQTKSRGTRRDIIPVSRNVEYITVGISCISFSTQMRTLEEWKRRFSCCCCCCCYVKGWKGRRNWGATGWLEEMETAVLAGWLTVCRSITSIQPLLQRYSSILHLHSQCARLTPIP